MKKVISSILALGIISSSFALTKDEAAKKIKEYVSGMKAVSDKITVCENKKYYIGEIYAKGYENFDVVRVIFVDKETGDILPSFAEHKSYCYMRVK